MSGREVKIKLPEVKLIVGNTEMVVLEPCTIQIDENKKTKKGSKVDEANQIKRAIKKKIPRNHIFWSMKQSILRELEKGVDIELDDGTEIKLEMNHQHGWLFEIPISKSMLNKATGRHVPVTYANFVHNALYKIRHGDESHVSPKAKATLIELAYIISGGIITKEGEAALERLAQVNPSKDNSCRMKLTRAMFCRNDPTLPAFEWAKDNGFIEYVKANAMPRRPWYVYDELAQALVSVVPRSSGNPRGACWYPTRTGAMWLEQNAAKILRHHSASRTRKIEMIPFMPLDYLSEYLSDSDDDVRGLAERRLQIIKRR